MKKIHKLILTSAAATLLLTGCAEDYKSDFNPTKPEGMAMTEFINSFDVLKSYTGARLASSIGLSSAEDQGTPYSQAVSNFNELSLTDALSHSAMVDAEGTVDVNTPEKAIDNIADKDVKIFGSTLCSPTSFNLSYMQNVVADTYVPGSVAEGDFDVEDFEDIAIGTAVLDHSLKTGSGSIVEDPTGTYGHCANFTGGFANPTFDITLPTGVTLGQIKSISYDYRRTAGWWVVQGVCKVVMDGTTFEVSPKSASEQGITVNNWGTMEIKAEEFSQILEKLTDTQKAATTFQLGLGEIVGGGNYYIDNIRIHANYNQPGHYEPRPVEEKKADAIEAMTKYINGVVGLVGDKADGWIIASDALNAGTEMGVLKNAETSDNADSEIYLNDYLGDNFVADLAKIAHAANPNLKLFYSDYDLENDAIKLDNCCNMLKQWNDNGAQLAGVDAQVHLIYNPADMDNIKAGYENMLEKLAATGLSVRLSALDMVATDANGFNVNMENLTEDQLKGMADFYSYIISTYLAKIPAAQQYGFSFSSINQSASNVGLWSDNNRLPTYVGVANGLKSIVTEW